MSRDEILSKQLAHNSLEGSDDPGILKTIYLRIQEADLRIRAYIDEAALRIPDVMHVRITPLSTGMNFRHVSMMFLPYQLDEFNKCLDRLKGDEEMVLVADIKHWEKFVSALQAVQKIDDIRSIGTAVARMSEIVLEKLEWTPVAPD